MRFKFTSWLSVVYLYIAKENTRQETNIIFDQKSDTNQNLMNKNFTNTALKATMLYHLTCSSFSEHKFVTYKSYIPISSQIGT